MTMAFKTISNAIGALLAANAAGRYTVEGYQRQSHSAEEILKNLRHLTVFYGGGTFDEATSGEQAGPFDHRMTFTVEILLSADSGADLRVLEDESASQQAYAAALAASIPATQRANDSWDGVFALAWNILMDPRNYNLGLASPAIMKRWVSSATKGKAFTRGEYVILPGTFEYTCTAVETPTGETPVSAGTNAIDVAITETADPSGATVDTAQQGVKTQ